VQHFIGGLVGPRGEVGQLVTNGHDLQKSADQSSAAVVQKHVSLIVTRWTLLEEHTKETLTSLQVLLVLLCVLLLYVCS